MEDTIIAEEAAGWLVRLEEGGKTVTGRGSDTDTLVAAARVTLVGTAQLSEPTRRHGSPADSVVTFALPQGLWPKNRALAWRGSWTDPKTKKVTTYDYDTVLEVSGGPNRSPFDPEFDRTKLNRVIVFGNELEKTLDRLDKSKTRFVWDGGGVAVQQ